MLLYSFLSIKHQSFHQLFGPHLSINLSLTSDRPWVFGTCSVLARIYKSSSLLETSCQEEFTFPLQELWLPCLGFYTSRDLTTMIGSADPPRPLPTQVSNQNWYLHFKCQNNSTITFHFLSWNHIHEPYNIIRFTQSIT